MHYSQSSTVTAFSNLSDIVSDEQSVAGLGGRIPAPLPNPKSATASTQEVLTTKKKIGNRFENI